MMIELLYPLAPLIPLSKTAAPAPPSPTLTITLLPAFIFKFAVNKTPPPPPPPPNLPPPPPPPTTRISHQRSSVGVKEYCVCPVNPNVSLVYVKDIALSVVPINDEVAPATVISDGNERVALLYSYFIGSVVIAVDAKGVSDCPPAGSIEALVLPIDNVYAPFTVLDTPFTNNVVGLLKFKE